MSANVRKFPVVGYLIPAKHPLPANPFYEFDTGPVCGQCRVDGSRIDFLNVVTIPQYRGHFRRFVRQLRAHYKMIRMWAVDAADNPGIFRAMLAKYGFTRGVDVDTFGQFHEVWDLNQNTQ